MKTKSGSLPTPSHWPVRSIGINVEIAKLAGKPVALVINAAPAQGTQALVAGRDAGSRYGVEVCPIIIRQRAVFSHALVGSKCAQEVEPASKAAAEVAALWDWLARRATGQNQSDAASMAAPDPNYSRHLAVGDASATGISRMVGNYRIGPLPGAFQASPGATARADTS